MNDKLSLNCSGTERRGGCGGVEDTEGGMGSAEGRGYLIVNVGQKARECGQFQSRVDGMVGVGVGRSARHNKGRQWTGQSASGKQQMQRQPSKQWLFVCIPHHLSPKHYPLDSLLLHTNHKMIYAVPVCIYAVYHCFICIPSLVISSVSASIHS